MGFLDRFKRKPPPAASADIRAFFNQAAADEEHRQYYPADLCPGDAVEPALDAGMMRNPDLRL